MTRTLRARANLKYHDSQDFFEEGDAKTISLNNALLEFRKPHVICSWKNQQMLTKYYRWVFQEEVDTFVAKPDRERGVFMLQLRDGKGGPNHDWVYVADSNLPGAGKGLFAAKRFQKQAVLGIYWGYATMSSKSNYKIWLKIDGKKMLIDTKRNQLRLGFHFMNDPSQTPKTDRKPYHPTPNVELKADGTVIALKTIRRNAELLLDCNLDENNTMLPTPETK